MELEKLKQYFSNIENLLISKDSMAYCNDIVASSIAIIDIFKSYLELVHNEKLSLDPIQQELLTFSFSQTVKDASIFIRDLNFRLYKDNNAPQLIANNHKGKANDQKSLTILRDIEKTINKEYLGIIQDPKIDDSLRKKWYFYNSPISLVLEQLEEIKNQISLFEIASTDLGRLNTSFKSFKFNTLNSINDLTSRLSQLESLVGDKSFEVNNRSSLTKLEKILIKFKEEIQLLANQKISFVNFNIPRKLSRIPIQIVNNKLITKEINFKQQLIAWFDSEIKSDILAKNQNINALIDRILLANINSLNRLQAYNITTQDQKNESKNLSKQQIVAPILRFKGEISEILESSKLLHANIKLIIEKNLKSEKIFDPQKLFLKSNFELSLTDYTNSTSNRIENSRLLKKAKNILATAWHKIVNPEESKIRTPDAYSYMDKTQIPPESEFNHTLFLSKGFLGHSFYIPRIEIENLIKGLHSNHKLGFNSSLLLFGKRLSGRSTMCQAIEHILEDTTVLFLEKNGKIELNNKKISVGVDIDKAFKFIVKNAMDEKLVLVLDDLEMWRDDKVPLHENINSLLFCLKKYSDSIFTVVSTNIFFKEHVDFYFDFSEKFSAQIDTDFMSANNIATAISTRYFASISDNNTINNTTMTIDEIEFKVKSWGERIAKSCAFNIGSSLIEWCRSVASVNQELILNSFKEDRIPVGFKSVIKKHKDLLLHFLKFKSTNEAELIRMVGKDFANELSQSFEPLFGLKILERKSNGYISINKVLVDEIEEELIKLDKQLI